MGSWHYISKYRFVFFYTFLHMKNLIYCTKKGKIEHTSTSHDRKLHGFKRNVTCSLYH